MTKDYEDLRGMVDWDELKKFRDRALNPEHPTIRNSGENDDIFFQHREASNPTYLAFLPGHPGGAGMPA